ncbi:hypothetical protein BU16DRAFT_563861 [Lophium mytilinum]|uniref:Uncharacterized protein n=1 Tax=Lophium mytilinum TaxID=390894 RepID=A0A6A6QNR6_9PEZI|nr:hypothetical protein BU16DRAFT_563861 [Lophium mytilinum]
MNSYIAMKNAIQEIDNGKNPKPKEEPKEEPKDGPAQYDEVVILEAGARFVLPGASQETRTSVKKVRKWLEQMETDPPVEYHLPPQDRVPAEYVQQPGEKPPPTPQVPPIVPPPVPPHGWKKWLRSHNIFNNEFGILKSQKVHLQSNQRVFAVTFVLDSYTYVLPEQTERSMNMCNLPDVSSKHQDFQMFLEASQQPAGAPLKPRVKRVEVLIDQNGDRYSAPWASRETIKSVEKVNGWLAELEFDTPVEYLNRPEDERSESK